MQKSNALILIALLSSVTAVLNAAVPPHPTCNAAEYRQFDFWLGEWNVYAPGGKLAGVNRITREYGGCVIHEHYVTDRDYSGESLNIYDASRHLWHQSWVDSEGVLLQLEGGLQGSNMVLQGVSTAADSKGIRQRIIWSTNADGSVRQLWMAHPPGKNWQTVFDGTYRRAPRPGT